MRIVLAGFLSAILTALTASPAPAFVYIPYTLGDFCKEARTIVVLRVDSVDREKKGIVFKHMQNLKGAGPADGLVQKFGKDFLGTAGELHPVDEAEVGQQAVFFECNGNGIILVGRAWYHVYKNGNDWVSGWTGSDCLHAFWGVPGDLIPAVKDVLAGKEALVECMVNRVKDASGRPQIARVRASLQRNGFDPKRDRAD